MKITKFRAHGWRFNVWYLTAIRKLDDKRICRLSTEVNLLLKFIYCIISCNHAILSQIHKIVYFCEGFSNITENHWPLIGTWDYFIVIIINYIGHWLALRGDHHHKCAHRTIVCVGRKIWLLIPKPKSQNHNEWIDGVEWKFALKIVE